MYLIYFIARIYPWVALSLVIAFAQLGIDFYRKRNKILYVFFFTLTTMIFMSGLMWLIFRGDLHSEEWVRAIFGSVL